MPGIDSEALDFRAASESFAAVRKLARRDLETLRLVTRQRGRKVPTVGGMILFGMDRERHFPDGWIQVGRFCGTDKKSIVDRAEIHAFPVPAVEEATAFVQKYTLHRAEIGKLGRKERWSLPPVAVREAVVNAVVHTDYAQRGAPIRLSIFDDHLEIENPGLLPFGLTVEDLSRGVSKLRNRVIGRIFHALGLIEQWGSGVQRMNAACSEAGLVAPVFEELATRFRVTIPTAVFGPPLLDETNRLILACLSDGQGWLTSEIAGEIDLTPRATRTRLAKLVGQGLIHEIGTGPQDPRRRYFRAERSASNSSRPRFVKGRFDPRSEDGKLVSQPKSLGFGTLGGVGASTVGGQHFLSPRMNMKRSPSISAAVLFLSSLAPAFGQATSVAVPGSVIDVFGTPTSVINAASFLHDTSQGGYVFDITACPSNFSYGRIATEPLQVFGSEATSLPYKTSYVAPSGLVLHRGTAELFLDDLSVAKTGDPVPGVPGATWSTLLGHGITDAEEELVEAFYTKSDGTSVAAAFVGLDKPPPYSSDMPLGPTGEVGYATSTPYFSPNGQHVVYTADLLSTNGLRFKHVILDGAAYCLGGSPVVEGEPVPASIGGLPGELWQNFAFFDVTDDGRVLFAGDSNASGSRDDFLVKDGSIFLREGDTIDGFTLAEDVSQPQWTLDGRVAFVWSVNGSHGTEDIVGLEDHIYLFESDPVDWDADGFADDEFTVTSLGFTAVLTVDSKLVFQVSAQLPSGSFSSAVFELPVGFLIPRTWLVSAASGGSIDFDLDAGAGASGQFYALAGSMSGTSPGFPLASANIPLNPDAYFAQTLGEANSPSFVSTLGVLDAQGRASAQVVVPQDLSLVGLRAHHAAIRFELGPLTIHEVSAAAAVEIIP